jgi:hydroxypyruvate isomerase
MSVETAEARGIRWSANLSMLWRERPFLTRFEAARSAGFETVEFWWPRGERLEDVEAAVKASGVHVALLNMDAGDLDAGERGFLNCGDRKHEVIEAAKVAAALAGSLGCGLMNVPVGKDSGESRARQSELVVDALKEIVEQASRFQVRVTLEPLNSIEHPTYLMCSPAAALDWIQRVGAGIGLLYDVYHMGRMGEDIVAAPNVLRPVHIQIADAPGRHEPGTGRLPFDAFFASVVANDYAGCIGLEYAPSTLTDETFGWLAAYQPAGSPFR